jgi:hypothetical protein
MKSAGEGIAFGEFAKAHRALAPCLPPSMFVLLTRLRELLQGCPFCPFGIFRRRQRRGHR